MDPDKKNVRHIVDPNIDFNNVKSLYFKLVIMQKLIKLVQFHPAFPYNNKQALQTKKKGPNIDGTNTDHVWQRRI